MKIFYSIALVLVLYTTLCRQGLASINIGENTSDINLSSQVEIAVAPNDFNPSELSTLKFSPNSKNYIGLGYNNQQSVIKFTILNTSNSEITRFLYFNSINGTLKLYKENNLNNYTILAENGTDIPYAKRSPPSLFGAIELKLLPNQSNHYLLTTKSRHNMNGELRLSDKDTINQTEVNQIKFANFYLGGILFLIIYNFLIFLFLKDKIYLFYSLYAGAFTLATLVIFGRLDQILNLSLISFSHYLICFSAASLFSACIFTFHFLEIKRLLPGYVKFFKFICLTSVLLFLSGLLPILGDYPKYFGIIIDIAIFTSILFFNYLAFNIVKKSSSAVFYLFSWGLILISLFVWFGMSFGFLSVNFITIHALPIGNMLEMLTLSFALAYKIQQLNADKLAALTKARDKEKYERLVRVLSHDVANSLTVVNSYSKKMIQNDQLDEVTRKQAEKIYSGSENIKSILQIVREQELLVSQNKQMNLELINVLECVQLSELLYEEMLSTKKMRLNISIEKNLIITADKICFINNILNNLISNAIKFSTENSEIKIYSEKTIDHNVICIKDYGIGIKSELINDIFYTNKIISTSGTNQEAGNGLGSNLVREYMLLFGGSISVESKTKDSNNLDSGTLIKLFFPIER